MGPSVRPQAKICKFGFSVLPEILDFEWSLVLDIDEFLSIDRHSFPDIQKFFRYIERNKIDALGINWKYVSPDRNIQYTLGLVTQKLRFFTDDSIIGAANSLIKSMSVSRKTISYTSHTSVFPRKTGSIYRLIQGDFHRYAHNQAGYSDNPMWADHIHLGVASIIHYHFKSAEELLLRLYRGDAMQTYNGSHLSIAMYKEDIITSFVEQYGKNGEEIDGRMLVPADRLNTTINKMMEIKSVHDAMTVINHHTRERIRAMAEFMEQNLNIMPESVKRFHKILHES